MAILVELEEQATMLLAADLMGRDIDPSALKVGLPMRVEFIQTSDPTIVRPEFRFTEDGAA